MCFSSTGYGCEVTCLAGPSLGLATLEAALVVEAVAEGDGGLRSGQVQLPFLPAPAPESPTLTLTNQQPTASLLLRGHPDVLAAMAVGFFYLVGLLWNFTCLFSFLSIQQAEIENLCKTYFSI